MENINKKRIIGLDLIKTIAIIFVIARHVPLIDFNNVTSLSDYWYLQLLVNLASCGVPLFFAVDGYLLLSKKDFDINKHIKKLIKIIILYFAWSFILIIINLIFDNTGIDRFIIVDLILKLNNTSLYTSELWFLEVLFAIYIIYPFIWYVFSKDNKTFNVLLTIVLCFTVIPSLIDMLCPFINNQYHVMYLEKLAELISKFNIFNYGWYLLYFLIGGFIYKNKHLLDKHKYALIVGGVIALILSFIYSYTMANKGLFLENFNDTSIFEIFIIIGFFALFLNMNIDNNKLSIIGKNTFGIYVTHQYLIRIARLFIGQDTFIENLLIVVVVLIVSTIVSYLLGLIPFIKKLVKI